MKIDFFKINMCALPAQVVSGMNFLNECDIKYLIIPWVWSSNHKVGVVIVIQNTVQSFLTNQNARASK